MGYSGVSGIDCGTVLFVNLKTKTAPEPKMMREFGFNSLVKLDDFTPSIQMNSFAASVYALRVRVEASIKQACSFSTQTSPRGIGGSFVGSSLLRRPTHMFLMLRS